MTGRASLLFAGLVFARAPKIAHDVRVEHRARFVDIGACEVDIGSSDIQEFVVARAR